MKTWHPAAVLAMVAWAGCATPSRMDVGGHQWDSPRRAQLTVYGLSCPLCAHNLTEELRAIEGVADTQIDLQTGAVAVQLHEGHTVSPDDLARAVKRAGFTLKEVQAIGD